MTFSSSRSSAKPYLLKLLVSFVPFCPASAGAAGIGLRLVPCEAMLSHAASAAGVEGPLRALEALRAQLGAKPGPERQLRTLTEIEAAATPGLDAQVVTLVFRGDQVGEGMRRFAEAHARLGDLYRSYRVGEARAKVWLERVVTGAAFTTVVILVSRGATALTHDGARALANPVELVNVVLSVPAAAVTLGLLARAVIKLNHLDLSSRELLHRLRALERGTLHRPYLSREILRTDHAFVSELLSTAGLTDATRVATARAARATLIEDLRTLRESLRSPEALHAYNDAHRNVYLNHVLYVDQGSREPVWIFVLRSERRVRGRRPPRRWQDLKGAEQMGWAG